MDPSTLFFSAFITSAAGCEVVVALHLDIGDVEKEGRTGTGKDIFGGRAVLFLRSTLYIRCLTNGNFKTDGRGRVDIILIPSRLNG